MNPEQQSIIESLSKNYPKLITTYKPATWVAIQTLDVLLDGKLHPYLKSIYEYSDGLGLLDYCVLGCSNKKIMSLARDNDSFWAGYPELENRFISFMGTSACETFGYLVDVTDGSRPFGYNQNDRAEGGVLVISSSVEKFFQLFIQELERTIVTTNGKEQYGITTENWPMDLNFWFSHDEDLKVLYDKYKFPIPRWASDQTN
jgi:hypothetical protein